MKRGLAVAVVDPLSLLGRDIQAVLKERGFPFSKLHLFHTENEPGNLLIDDGNEAAFVAPLTPEALEDCQIAFLCGSAYGTTRFLKARPPGPCVLIDLTGGRSGAFVRPDEPLPDGGVLVTHDPTAFVLADVLRLLAGLATLSGVSATVDRPVSDLGKAALDELFDQAMSLAVFRPVPKKILGTQAAFNIFTPPDSEAYEAIVVEDVGRLLRPLEKPVPVRVISARAGVFHGHLIRLEARFEGAAPSAADIRAAFERNPAYELVDAENLSGPVECAGRDETLVLRVSSEDGAARLTLCSDHLRRPGALLAVRIAEQLVLERGLLAS